MTTASNLRKAAVLIRSLDADTAATMLAQLSPQEAAAVRGAIRSLGAVEPEEQADVAAEFRRVRPYTAQSAAEGVELSVTAPAEPWDETPPAGVPPTHAKRFEFLEHAAIDSLVAYLAREHVQTIAVVLSHLRPARAASVLAALPQKLQVETLERLARLGETDRASVTVVENELAAWLAKRSLEKPSTVKRTSVVAAILAATDATVRERLISNVRAYKSALADELAPAERDHPPSPAGYRDQKPRAGDIRRYADAWVQRRAHPARRILPLREPERRIEFDQIVHLDGPALASVLRSVDANLLVLALAGSRDELVDRICNQMPKRMGRMFRRQLRHMGPTRLSDVAAAQQAVAVAATEQLARSEPATLATGRVAGTSS